MWRSGHPHGPERRRRGLGGRERGAAAVDAPWLWCQVRPLRPCPAPGHPPSRRSAGRWYLLFICLSAFPPRGRSREAAQDARQRKDLATARQERREAAGSESRRGRAGVGAPAPTPEERRTERPSGAARPQRCGTKRAGAASTTVRPRGRCPGSLPVPARHPATYFPWRRRSGEGRRESRPRGPAAGAEGSRCQAAAGVAAGLAARCRACSPHCAWCPPRWAIPARERGQASPGAGAGESPQTGGAGPGTHLLAVRHSPGTGLLGHAVSQVLVVVTGARLLAEVPRPPGGVGPAQAFGAALARRQLQRGARLSAAVPSCAQLCPAWPWDRAVARWGCPSVVVGQVPGWGTAGTRPGGPLGTRLCQGLHGGVAARAAGAWHRDPIACAQGPGRASPGITCWEPERRAPAPRITGSLSPVGSKPPSERGSQAPQPRLTPAHTAAALWVVLPSASAAGGCARTLPLGCRGAMAPLPTPGAPLFAFPHAPPPPTAFARRARALAAAASPS